MTERPFTAVVLAADRGNHDPVAAAAGVACKALAGIHGTPMLSRVLAALQTNREIGPVILSGPAWDIVTGTPELRDAVAAGKLGWVEPRGTPSTSIEAVLETLADQEPVLITTADHALLESRTVADFAHQARHGGYDVVAALVSYDLVKAAYPELRKTVLKFRDGAYCGCNLYAFLTPRSRKAAGFWRRVERQRKKPARVLGVIGWVGVIRYLLGRLSLPDALQHLSARMDIRVGVVLLQDPKAAVDVDTVEDWSYVQTLANRVESMAGQ